MTTDQTEAPPTQGLPGKRREAGLSRQALVDLMPKESRIWASHLYKIETGRSQPSVPTLEALAQALSQALGYVVTIGDLFPLDGGSGYDRARNEHTPG